MLQPGSLVGGYRIVRFLASGATGTVYLAQNPTLPRLEALKVLSAELSAEPAFRDRFIREADVACLLDHPNIVAIYKRGDTDTGQLWIAMQYVEGTDAEAVIHAGAMTPARAVHIVDEVAKALDYAHDHQVVHLDVKPSNVLLTKGFDGEGDRVLLSDFGAAQSVDIAHHAPEDDSTVSTTVGYAAPELITGDPVDGRADIYALACMLFRMLTGTAPFSSAGDTTATAIAHLQQPPPRISDQLPGATRQLDVVMARALAKNPAERFNSAREFARAAAAALAPYLPPTSGSTPSRLRTPTLPAGTLPTVLTRLPSRRRPAVIAATAAGLSLLIGGVLWLRPTADTPTEGPAAASSTSTVDTTTSRQPDPAQQDRLARLLPAGYPPQTCSPATITDDSTAAMTCGANIDPGGPASSTYALARDQAALDAALNQTIAESTAIICPPNFQSPGPWRHLDTPTIPRGTLFCGNRSGQPLIAWTTDELLLLGVVRAQAPTTLKDLYDWWASHS